MQNQLLALEILVKFAISFLDPIRLVIVRILARFPMGVSVLARSPTARMADHRTSKQDVLINQTSRRLTITNDNVDGLVLDYSVNSKAS